MPYRTSLDMPGEVSLSIAYEYQVCCSARVYKYISCEPMVKVLPTEGKARHNKDNRRRMIWRTLIEDQSTVIKA